MITAKVQEYAIQSSLNCKINVTARLTKNDKKNYEKERKLHKILAAVYLIDCRFRLIN